MFLSIFLTVGINKKYETEEQTFSNNEVDKYCQLEQQSFCLSPS